MVNYTMSKKEHTKIIDKTTNEECEEYQLLCF